MICTLCADAADRRAPADQHCTDPKCMCGHRTDRYRPLNGLAALAAMYDQLARIGDQHAARVEAAITRIEQAPGDRTITFPPPTPRRTDA